MADFWLGWKSRSRAFELHSPWWYSGYGDDYETMVAAVRAEDEAAAFEQIRLAYDDPPEAIEERFCEPLIGSPFNPRFPQEGWMTWTDERTCACPDHAEETSDGA